YLVAEWKLQLQVNHRVVKGVKTLEESPICLRLGLASFGDTLPGGPVHMTGTDIALNGQGDRLQRVLSEVVVPIVNQYLDVLHHHGLHVRHRPIAGNDVRSERVVSPLRDLRVRLIGKERLEEIFQIILRADLLERPKPPAFR